MNQTKNDGQVFEYYGFDRWLEFAETAHSLATEFPDRIKVISYSNLLNNTEKVVASCFEFLRLEFSSQTTDFILKGQKKNKTEDAYSVFRTAQKDDKWKDNIPPQIVESIVEQLDGSEYEQYLA